MRCSRRVATAVLLVVAVTAVAVAGTLATATDAGGPTGDAVTANTDATPGTAGTDAETDADTQTTPTRLGVGGGERVAGVGAPTARLGPAVSVGDGELRARYERYRVRERLAGAGAEPRRRAVVQAVLAETATTVERLRSRETTAVRAYHEGRIDREELLRRLAAVHRVAGEYRRTLEEVQTRAGGALTFESSTELSTLSRRLAVYRSPVRERAAEGLTGTAVPPVGVTATDAGVVLETADDGEYVREAVRLDRYNGSGARLNSTPEVVDRLRAVYPDAFSESRQHSIAQVGDRLFRAEFPHTRGEVRTYFNRDGGAVYREVQWLRLDRLETTAVAERTAGGVTVTVARVGDRDPTLVRLVDTDGDPVEATVGVGNGTAGRTTDGRLWVVTGEPPTEVTVELPAETVTVTVGANDGTAAATEPTAGASD